MHQLVVEEAITGGGNLHRSSLASNACLGAFGGSQTFTVLICDVAALPPLRPFVRAALSGGHTLAMPIHDATAFPLLHPLVREALSGCYTSTVPIGGVSDFPPVHPLTYETYNDELRTVGFEPSNTRQSGETVIRITDEFCLTRNLFARGDSFRNELRGDLSGLLDETSSGMLSALSSNHFEEVDGGAASSVVPLAPDGCCEIGTPRRLKRGANEFERGDSISVKYPDYEFDNAMFLGTCDIVHCADNVRMVVGDGHARPRNTASTLPLDDRMMGNSDDGAIEGGSKQMVPLVLEFARAHYYAFNPRPIRAGSFGQPYSGESSSSFRPAHVDSSVFTPTLNSEAPELNGPASMGVGVFRDVAIPSRMPNENLARPVVRAGIVDVDVMPLRATPHPHTKSVIPMELARNVGIPLRMTHVIPVLPRVPLVAENDVYADISAEDFARGDQAPVSLTPVVMDIIPHGCVTVAPISDSYVVRHSGGHTSTEVHCESRIAPTLPEAEPQRGDRSAQRNTIPSKPRKTTVREVVANIEQGGFAKGTHQSGKGSGSVDNAGDDLDDDQRDAQSESSSIRSLAVRKCARDMLLANVEICPMKASMDRKDLEAKALMKQNDLAMEQKDRETKASVERKDVETKALIEQKDYELN
jgi:hypothetical protein